MDNETSSAAYQAVVATANKEVLLLRGLSRSNFVLNLVASPVGIQPDTHKLPLPPKTQLLQSEDKDKDKDKDNDDMSVDQIPEEQEEEEKEKELLTELTVGVQIENEVELRENNNLKIQKDEINQNLLFMDPGVSAEMTSLRIKLGRTEKELSDLKADMTTITNFTRDGPLGKRLEARCRKLQSENSEMGSLLLENRIGTLNPLPEDKNQCLSFLTLQVKTLYGMLYDLEEECDAYIRSINQLAMTNQSLAIENGKLESQIMDIQRKFDKIQNTGGRSQTQNVSPQQQQQSASSRTAQPTATASGSSFRKGSPAYSRDRDRERDRDRDRDKDKQEKDRERDRSNRAPRDATMADETSSRGGSTRDRTRASRH